MARNKLLASPPYPVEQSLQKLGANLRTARIRRNITMQDIAEKIGVSRQSISDAEKGKPSTSIAVYMALLWALNLLPHMSDVADPNKDDEGSRLALSREKTRAKPTLGLDNDF